MSKIIIRRLDDSLLNDDILYNFNGKTNCADSISMPVYIDKKPMNFECYKKSFYNVQSAQRRGESYLLNLTFPTEININISADEIFRTSHAPYKIKYRDNFVFFSPERFVKIEKGIITTSPMKGTRVKTDEFSELELLDDAKEAAEHLTVVDLLRNDLNMVAEDVEVERYRYITHVCHQDKIIIQTSSDISGRLKYDNPFHALLKLLPAGSICGAPKKRTMELILENESDDRGFYTGISGIFDGETIDTCVNIRYIEFNHGKTYFRSGGGITVYSKAEDEFQELLDKIYVPAF